MSGHTPGFDYLAFLERAAKMSPTGISIDWVPACEGDPSGFRFMRKHHIGLPCKTVAEALLQAHVLGFGREGV